MNDRPVEPKRLDLDADASVREGFAGDVPVSQATTSA